MNNREKERELELAAPDANEDDYDDGEYDQDRFCSHCGGEGTTECNDPIECMDRHDKFGWCHCKYCGGSGLAKDQTVW